MREKGQQGHLTSVSFETMADHSFAAAVWRSHGIYCVFLLFMAFYSRHRTFHVVV
jgi:hypothetical protein